MKRFHIVAPNLYRGSAPSVDDVVFLKNKLGINKIISLDAYAGNKINRICKLLKIKHIVIPIDVYDKSSALKLLKYNLYDLLVADGPTFVHCVEGKDRTGLIIAMFRCKYQNWPCEKAIKEAKKYGFGIGLDASLIEYYKKIINSFCNNHDQDNNEAYDIVSNTMDLEKEYRDYTFDAHDKLSWSPYDDYRIRQYPYSNTNKEEYNEQYENRNDYGLKDIFYDGEENITNRIPTSGIYDSSTNGIMGAGPSGVGSGYI